MNPIKRALANADKIIAANNNLEAMSRGVFHDRREPLDQPGHPDAVRARLTSSRAALRAVPDQKGTYHAMHGGRPVGTVFDFGPTTDQEAGRYAVSGAGDLGYTSKARALRMAVAMHDVKANKLAGFTSAHHDYIAGKLR